jgi:hypothetical protein
MEQSDKELNDILNEIFPILKGKQKTPKNVAKAFSCLVSSNKNDLLIPQFHLFFYPNESSSEINDEKEFWFQKYKSNTPEDYTEYNFALDILKILKSYLQNKNSEDANTYIYDLALKFGAYKNIDYYLLLTGDKIQSNLIHIYSFFHKDIQYFKDILDVNVEKTDDLKDKKTLEKLFVNKTISKEELNCHKLYAPIINELQQKINILENKINEQNIINENQKVINDTQKNAIDELIQFKQEASNKLEQIYLRDTIKYSIKYIYRMFYSKLSGKFRLEFSNNIYEEIKQLKIILSNKSFTNFSYIKEFIEAVEFGDLMVLNKVSHPSLADRKIKDIIKYVDNRKPYLNKVVEFLENLPDLEKYINMEVIHYFSKSKLENEISKNYNFEEIYDKKIGVTTTI